jgi:polyphosphate kinase 2 (PPK2 family)
VEERGYWNDYMHAYGEAIAATSTKQSPWYIVPADDKRNARLIVSEIVAGLLDGLDLQYPPAGPERRRELQAIRRRLS